MRVVVKTDGIPQLQCIDESINDSGVRAPQVLIVEKTVEGLTGAMRYVLVTSQHHHSNWHVHLLDCVTDSIQTDHNDQLDVSLPSLSRGSN